MTLIGTSLPVNAGIEQTQASNATSPKPIAAQTIDRVTQVSTKAEIAESSQGNLPSQSSQSYIDKEQIRVSVTTGEINIKGNLSPAKATQIYQQIAKLL